MSSFVKPSSGALRGTAMALTDLPSIATATVLGNISGSSTTPSAVSLVSAATASTVMFRDTNANVQINNINEGFTTTATAAGTTVLSVSSTYFQQFTGTTTQTVTLPSTSTLVVGQAFQIMNRSTGAVTVQTSTSASVQVMAAGTQCIFTCTSTSGNTAAAWDAAYSSTNASGVTYRAGSQSIGSGVTTVSVTYSSAMPNTSYAITCNFVNTTDTNVQFQPIEITAFSTTGFTAKWNGATATANYSLMWHVIANN